MEKDMLAQYGIDYEKGLKNCMGNPIFYQKIMTMFLADTNFPRAKAAWEYQDQSVLFACLHELKGISGNAALTELYQATVPLLELTRKPNAPFDEVGKLFSAVERAYARACDGMKRYLMDY